MPLLGPPNVEKLKAKRNVKGLIRALTHEDAAIRLDAAKALGELGDPRAVDPLVALIVSETYSSVQRAAAIALGALESEEAVPKLMAGLPPTPTLTLKTIDLLAHVGGGYAVNTLTEELKNDYLDRETRVAILHALGLIGSPKAIDVLLAEMGGAEYDAALEAAAMMGESVIFPLVTVLNTGNSRQKRAAVRVLSRLNSVNTFLPLVKALQDEDASVRETVAEALEWSKDVRAVRTLLVGLKDPEPSVRKKAARALGRQGSPLAVTDLIQAVQDENPGVRQEAVWALGRLKAEAALGALTLSLQDSAPAVAQEAAWALGQIRDKRTIPSLILAMRSQDKGVRRASAEAVEKVADKSAVKPLQELLDSPLLEVKLKAAELLAKLGSGMGVERLLEAMQKVNVRDTLVTFKEELQTRKQISESTRQKMAYLENYQEVVRVLEFILERVVDDVPLSVLMELTGLEVYGIRPEASSHGRAFGPEKMNTARIRELAIHELERRGFDVES